jgi:hypothetical protein
MNLEQENERATEMLKGKIVAKVMRPRTKEVCIEFTDGTRLFVNHNPEDVELSITGFDEK